MGLVIAIFIVTAAYIGYHASQEVPEEGGGHNISTELEILNNSLKPIHSIQEYSLVKSMI